MDQARPSQLVIIASGAAMLLFSFMNMGGDSSGSAWEDLGLITLPAILGAISAAAIAVSAFGKATLPDQIVTLRPNQVVAVFGLTSTLVLVGFWYMTSTYDFDLKAPFWLSLIGAIGLLVGAAMDIKADDGATTKPGATPPTPF